MKKLTLLIFLAGLSTAALSDDSWIEPSSLDLKVKIDGRVIFECIDVRKTKTVQSRFGFKLVVVDPVQCFLPSAPPILPEPPERSGCN